MLVYKTGNSLTYLDEVPYTEKARSEFTEKTLHERENGRIIREKSSFQRPCQRVPPPTKWFVDLYEW